MLIFEKISFKIYDYLLELSTEYSIIIILVESYIYLKVLLPVTITSLFVSLFVAFLCSLLFFILKKSRIIL